MSSVHEWGRCVYFVCASNRHQSNKSRNHGADICIYTIFIFVTLKSDTQPAIACQFVHISLSFCSPVLFVFVSVSVLSTFLSKPTVFFNHHKIVCIFFFILLLLWLLSVWLLFFILCVFFSLLHSVSERFPLFVGKCAFWAFISLSSPSLMEIGIMVLLCIWLRL